MPQPDILQFVDQRTGLVREVRHRDLHSSLPGELSLETRETDQVLHTELLRPDGLLVHRSLIAFW